VLTKKQLDLLYFIHDYVQRHHVPPSFDEMRHAMGLKSKSGIHRLVSGLEERGHIRRLAYRARAVEILKPPPGVTLDETSKPQRPARREAAPPAGTTTPKPDNVLHGNFRKPTRVWDMTLNRVPVYGRIAAGTPIEALADTSREIEVPSMMLGSGDHFVLEVEGDSMIDAGIMSGDLAVIRRCNDAENGAIVVALVNDHEVTLKRLRRRGASIALEPANKAYETRIFGPQEIEVQGRLVGLLRSY